MGGPLMAISKGVGRLFWYVSRPKLDALSVEGSSWLDRVSFVAKLGLGPAGLEAGIKPSNLATLQRAVDRLEKRLRRDKSLVAVSAISAGDPVRFFEYEGPTVRVAAPIFALGYPAFREQSTGLPLEAWWAAARCGSVGVLLVGSITNAIGAKPEMPKGLVFSPSADPLGAVAFLFEAYGKYDLEAVKRQKAELLQTGKPKEAWAAEEILEEHRRTARAIPYSWSCIMKKRPHGLPVSSLPRTKGVALYAGMQDVSDDPIIYLEHGRQRKILMIVVGSPIWIEQIGS
jgi:hypothetical protein